MNTDTPDPVTVLTAAFWNFDLNPPDAQRIAAHAVTALVEAGLLPEVKLCVTCGGPIREGRRMAQRRYCSPACSPNLKANTTKDPA